MIEIWTVPPFRSKTQSVSSFGIESLLESGRLEIVFPDWLDERFPLYALRPSRNYLPLKTRELLDFVIAFVKSPA
jgi:DNA-binding transcriptional LysR family regulator